jgi:CAP-Gly domain-containing linker protein 1
LYEGKLSDYTAKRFEMEDTIKSLQDTLTKTKAAAIAEASANGVPPPYTAAQIDNEALQEHVTHLQRKVTLLEESLDDARASHERDESVLVSRLTKLKEGEALLKQEVERERGDKTVKEQEVESLKQRLTEVGDALNENKAALEDARAEIETLRVDVEVSIFGQSRSCHIC